MSEITRARLLDALFSVARSASADESVLTVHLRRALLDFGSNTDENVAAVSRVEVGPIDVATFRKGQGMRLTGTNIALSSVVNTAEGSAVPQQVREYFPDFKQEDWDAVLRVTCLVLVSLEAPDPKS